MSDTISRQAKIDASGSESNEDEIRRLIKDVVTEVMSERKED